MARLSWIAAFLLDPCSSNYATRESESSLAYAWCISCTYVAAMHDVYASWIMGHRTIFLALLHTSGEVHTIMLGSWCLVLLQQDTSHLLLQQAVSV